MESQVRVMLTETLNALERLLRLFRIERILHLVVGVVAFLMLLYAIVLLLFRSNSNFDTALLVSLFGSSGLIAVSSARITFFFNKAFTLIEDVIHHLIKSGKES
jgi:hypothetical protein